MPDFLVWAPPYTHRSSGVRALYRLCHHLNSRGHSCAMLVRPAVEKPAGLALSVVRAFEWRWRRLRQAMAPGAAPTERAEIPAHWRTAIHHGPVGDSIVIYPEVVSGNPFQASKVVRWALNNPGLLGGDTFYPDEELVFVYDPQRLEVVNQAIRTPIGPERVLWMGLVDPDHIYPDQSVPKTIDCSFTHKGHALKARFPLPETAGIVALEDHTSSMAALGDTLRRTRTLYSYDHYSNVLREAAICGCDVRVIGDDGVWHDPRTCDCAVNIVWEPGFAETYAAKFHDSAFVDGFLREVRSRWP
jgi:hypothetical protein